jgi:TolB-like protein
MRPASVAVLPFQVVGPPDSTSVPFRNGLREIISRHLAAMPGLRVAPPTSEDQLAGRSVRDIGRALGVELVLEGTLQCGTDRIRVTANLVDAALERSVMPALRIERPSADLSSTRDEIARAICDRLARRIGMRIEGAAAVDC